MAFPADIDPVDPRPIDVQKVAFAVWISKLIADADGVLDLGEIRLLTQTFPNQLLQRLGLMDARAEFTDLYKRSYRDAVKTLPVALSADEKLELVTVFHALCMADDELQQAELLVLREAAEVLGITVRQLSDHLSSRRKATTG